MRTYIRARPWFDFPEFTYVKCLRDVPDDELQTFLRAVAAETIRDAGFQARTGATPDWLTLAWAESVPSPDPVLKSAAGRAFQDIVAVTFQRGFRQGQLPKLPEWMTLHAAPSLATAEATVRAFVANPPVRFDLQLQVVEQRAMPLEVWDRFERELEQFDTLYATSHPTEPFPHPSRTPAGRLRSQLQAVASRIERHLPEEQAREIEAELTQGQPPSAPKSDVGVKDRRPKNDEAAFLPSRAWAKRLGLGADALRNKLNRARRDHKLPDGALIQNGDRSSREPAWIYSAAAIRAIGLDPNASSETSSKRPATAKPST